MNRYRTASLDSRRVYVTAHGRTGKRGRLGAIVCVTLSVFDAESNKGGSHGLLEGRCLMIYLLVLNTRYDLIDLVDPRGRGSRASPVSKFGYHMLFAARKGTPVFRRLKAAACAPAANSLKTSKDILLPSFQTGPSRESKANEVRTEAILDAVNAPCCGRTHCLCGTRDPCSVHLFGPAEARSFQRSRRLACHDDVCSCGSFAPSSLHP